MTPFLHVSLHLNVTEVTSAGDIQISIIVPNRATKEGTGMIHLPAEGIATLPIPIAARCLLAIIARRLLNV